jgi:hypothetical protein
MGIEPATVAARLLLLCGNSFSPNWLCLCQAMDVVDMGKSRLLLLLLLRTHGAAFDLDIHPSFAAADRNCAACFCTGRLLLSQFFLHEEILVLVDNFPILCGVGFSRRRPSLS